MGDRYRYSEVLGSMEGLEEFLKENGITPDQIVSLVVLWDE